MADGNIPAQMSIDQKFAQAHVAWENVCHQFAHLWETGATQEQGWLQLTKQHFSRGVSYSDLIGILEQQATPTAFKARTWMAWLRPSGEQLPFFWPIKPESEPDTLGYMSPLLHLDSWQYQQIPVALRPLIAEMILVQFGLIGEPMEIIEEDYRSDPPTYGTYYYGGWSSEELWTACQMVIYYLAELPADQQQAYLERLPLEEMLEVRSPDWFNDDQTVVRLLMEAPGLSEPVREQAEQRIRAWVRLKPINLIDYCFAVQYAPQQASLLNSRVEFMLSSPESERWMRLLNQEQTYTLLSQLNQAHPETALTLAKHIVLEEIGGGHEYDVGSLVSPWLATRLLIDFGHRDDQLRQHLIEARDINERHSSR